MITRPARRWRPGAVRSGEVHLDEQRQPRGRSPCNDRPACSAGNGFLTKVIVGTAAQALRPTWRSYCRRTCFGAQFKLVSGRYILMADKSFAIERNSAGDLSNLFQLGWTSGGYAGQGGTTPHRSGSAASPGNSRSSRLWTSQRPTSSSKVLGVYYARPLAGRPLVNAGHAADRVAALRGAFDAMTKDPAFLDEARRLQMDVQPATRW